MNTASTVMSESMQNAMRWELIGLSVHPIVSLKSSGEPQTQRIQREEPQQSHL